MKKLFLLELKLKLFFGIELKFFFLKEEAEEKERKEEEEKERKKVGEEIKEEELFVFGECFAPNNLKPFLYYSFFLSSFFNFLGFSSSFSNNSFYSDFHSGNKKRSYYP
jgi:hypothetical protein